MRAKWRSSPNDKPRPDVRYEFLASTLLYLIKSRAKNVDVDEVIQRVYSSTGGGKLPEPLPLSQMIDILIDFWEADGMFD